MRILQTVCSLDNYADFAGLMDTLSTQYGEAFAVQTVPISFPCICVVDTSDPNSVPSLTYHFEGK